MAHKRPVLSIGFVQRVGLVIKEIGNHFGQGFININLEATLVLVGEDVSAIKGV